MSRWRCPGCKTLHPTTGYPNTIEGYFVADTAVSGAFPYREADIEDWLEAAMKTDPNIRHAHLCPICGHCEVAPHETEEN